MNHEPTTNLVSPSQVRSLLQRHGLRPLKRLGQNYLIDRNVLDKIVRLAEPAESRFVLEIGPGLGTVTQALAEQAEKVVAVEIDSRLLPVLEETLGGLSNVEVVNADFLRLDLDPFLNERFGSEKCAAVSNLPYYITSPIIVRLLENTERFSRIVLMVQREVAERLDAKPRTNAYGSLTVFVQFHCDVQIAAHVSKNVFFPAPEVDSALIVLDPLLEPSVKTVDEQLFFRIVRAAFGKRRKTLSNALVTAAGESWPKNAVQQALEKAGIDPPRRGETLSLEEFARLADELSGLLSHGDAVVEEP